MHVCERHILVDEQLRLKWNPSVLSQTTIHLTHTKDMKDPGELLTPTHDHISVRSRMETPKDRVPFTLLDDLLLDLGHSPVIETLVSRSLDVHIAVSTYVVSFSIAPSTVRLSSSCRLPSNPRSRVLHTSSKAIPR